MPDESQQQVERLRRELDVDPRPPHDARASVDDNSALGLHSRRIIREGWVRTAIEANDNSRATPKRKRL